MNTHLIDHIDAKIVTAANFVSKFMPVSIDVDAAYEALLGCSPRRHEHPAMFKAFQEAVKFLPPAANFKRFNITLSDERIASVQARLTLTVKWPSFLFPDSELVLNPEDKLAALLDTPIHVATEWESLSFVWRQLRSSQFDLNVAQLAYLMPWIRECLADFDMYGLEDASKIELKSIEKELSTVMNDANVTFFPRMSKALKEIARSGKTLFAQYQLLDAAYTREALTQPVLTVERTPSLLEPWLKEHMAETLEEWKEDMAARRARRAEELTIRAAKKLLKG